MNTENQFIKGFNGGYLITKYKTDISNMLVKNLKRTDDFLEGFFVGREQQMIEKSLEKLKAFRVEKNDLNYEL